MLVSLHGGRLIRPVWDVWLVLERFLPRFLELVWIISFDEDDKFFGDSELFGECLVPLPMRLCFAYHRTPRCGDIKICSEYSARNREDCGNQQTLSWVSCAPNDDSLKNAVHEILSVHGLELPSRTVR